MTVFGGSRVLVFVAHPDDETLAAGGTVAKIAASGVPVHVAIAATGITSRRDVTDIDGELAVLRGQAAAALGVLGLGPDSLTLGAFPDNRMDSVALLDVIQWLEDVVARVQPSIVITHHLGCTNIDHRICHEAAVVATRPSPNRHIALLAAEVPSSTGYRRPAGFEPNFYVALTEREVEAKVAAMLCYGGEAQPDPWPRSPEVLRALAKVRGSEAGALFAEAFMLVRGFA